MEKFTSILVLFCASCTGIFGAAQILPLTTPVMIADFSAVGGFLMLATGFRICRLIPFSTANMLPSLLLAMPFTALWVKYVL